MAQVAIIIPSRTEKFLNRTIQDILEKATGEIEVFPVLDGYGNNPADLRGFEGVPYEPILDPRVKYIVLPNTGVLTKRQGINTAVSLAQSKFVMSLDAHCVIEKGFDEVLAADCEDNWVVVPRRRRIDLEKWEIADFGKQPIDYEYFMWQKLVPGFHDHSKHLEKGRFSGYKWDQKSRDRLDIPIDDIFTCQGSCWFMTKSWFNKMGFMKVDGYTGWGQEGEELCMTTILNGGRAVVNKKTSYGHLHKGKTHGRMYEWRVGDIKQSYDYAYKYWVDDNREFFEKLIDRFGPIPNFPENWKEILWKPSNI